MLNKQPLAKIVEEQKSSLTDNEVFDEIFLFLQKRKNYAPKKQKVVLNFEIDKNGQEKFWVTDHVFDANMGDLEVLEFENTFEVFPALFDENGSKMGGKQFTQNDFDTLLKNLFCERGVSLYTTQGKDELLSYAKTTLKSGRYEKTHPQIELDFVKDTKGSPRVFVTTREKDKTTLKKVEFCFINKACKPLNDQKLELLGLWGKNKWKTTH